MSGSDRRGVPTSDAARPLRVLQSFPEPRPTTNPYVTQLLDALRQRPGLQVDTFSWRRALLHGHDVVHVHWPEILLGGRTPLRRAGRRLATAALLARCVLARTAVVRTVHNRTPHEQPSATARWLLAALDRLTRRRILLTDVGRPDGPADVIPHGHYRDWFAGRPVLPRVPGRVAFVGLVRPYKAVDQLLAAFARVDDPGLTLHVVGSPSGRSLADQLTAAAAHDPRVTLRLAHVDDDEFVAVVTQAQLVVLPYTELHNSGAALAALSLDRPVLVPDNAVTRALADEVGEQWVLRFTGSLDAEDLRRAVTAASAVTGRPDLARRGWEQAGAAHEACYRATERAARRRA